MKYGHRVNGDLHGYKGQIYEGGIRVPFIVRWPEKIAPGSESDHFITLADILATTAGILKEKLPDTTILRYSGAFDLGDELAARMAGEVDAFLYGVGD